MEEKIYTTQEQVIDSLENMSNEKLIEIVNTRLEYEPIREILVKPLEPSMIDREVNVPFKTDELDEDGEPIMDMKKEIQQVASVFRKGIILALPTGASCPEGLKVGDIIVFNGKFNSVEFDLFKDSMLVKPYDVLFKVKA